MIENSIFHGVESVYTQGTIGILVEILQNQVTIVITNPYSLDKITLRKGHGIAIESVRERLQAYFGQSVQFQTFAGEGFIPLSCSTIINKRIKPESRSTYIN